MLHLVVALSDYTEEGQQLFPQVVICYSLETTLALIQGSGEIEIGRGPRGSQTMAKALKECAPLCKKGWFMWVLRTEDGFSYGVFRGPMVPTALTVRDTILTLSQERFTAFPMIYASQVGEKAVELIGLKTGTFLIHFSATPVTSPSPLDVLASLIKLCCEAVAEEMKEQTASFLRTVLTDAMRECHGSLIAVFEPDTKPATQLTKDGVLLKDPIRLFRLVEQHQTNGTGDSLAELLAYGQLLTGMIASDGIVLLDTKCRIHGYRIFLKEPKKTKENHRELVGGARRRAFSLLCELVDKQELRGCFIQSADGASEFYEGKRK